MTRTDKIIEAMKQITSIRNIAICAHIDHGKTTFCDGLLAGAGMMSAELAGNSRQLDFRQDEIERGITIDAAATSMLFSGAGSDQNAPSPLLINLIDTPGHIDFGGDVTRAMQVVDGCIVLVDAVEGVMPQTETVLRQALRACVKPILFINKVDRLIRELKSTPEQMQERFSTIIESVNKFIDRYAPHELASQWHVSVALGSVMFGSATHNWGLSLAVIRDKSVSLSQIIEMYDKGDSEVTKLRRIVPLHECVVQAVKERLPDPSGAAAYRIPLLWKGDVSSEVGRALLSCDVAGPAVFVVEKIEIEASSELATGRLFCGTISKGDQLLSLSNGVAQKATQLYIRNGSKKEQIDQACAGNIISIAGMDVVAGETVVVPSASGIHAFARAVHALEPVITKAIEPQRAVELAQLQTVLSQMQKEDPGLVVDVNKETGEYLISGYGELHLEIIENRIRDVKKLPVRTSAPLIVYREEISSPSRCEQTSSLDESSVSVSVAPLIEDQPHADVVHEFRGNMLCSPQRLSQSIIDAFCDVMRRGPLAGEQCHNMMVTVEKITGDNTGVIYPLFKEATRSALIAASPILLEPIQEIQVDGPAAHVGEIATLITSRKGDISDMTQDAEHVSLLATLPVASSLGINSDLRGLTSGRGSISIRRQFFARVAEKDQAKIVRALRDKKGLF